MCVTTILRQLFFFWLECHDAKCKISVDSVSTHAKWNIDFWLSGALKQRWQNCIGKSIFKHFISMNETRIHLQNNKMYINHHQSMDEMLIKSNVFVQSKFIYHFTSAHPRDHGKERINMKMSRHSTHASRNCMHVPHSISKWWIETSPYKSNDYLNTLDVLIHLYCTNTTFQLFPTRSNKLICFIHCFGWMKSKSQVSNLPLQ